MGVKTITRYVIKPLTYLFHRLTLHEYSYRWSVVMTTALVRDTAPSQPTSRYHSTSIRQNVSLIRYVLRRKILVWHWEIPNIILLSLTALTFHPLCRSWHNKLC